MSEEHKAIVLKIKLQEIGEYTLKIRKIQEDIVELLRGNT